MYNAEEIKSFVQETVQTAGERIKPLEENTRRIIEDTAERFRASSAGIRKVEENLKTRIDTMDMSQWIQQAELSEKLKGFVQSAVSRLDIPTEAEVNTLREGITRLRKDLTSMKKRVENRVLNKDLNALIKRVEKLEKARKAA